MGRITWHVFHQKAKNSTNCGRWVAAKYLTSLLRKPCVSTQVLTGTGLVGVGVSLAVGLAVARGPVSGMEVGVVVAVGVAVGVGAGVAAGAHALKNSTTTRHDCKTRIHILL